MTYETKRVLVTVKAYPVESKKNGEVVCMAGITDEGEWIRLYPVPFDLFRGGHRKLKKFTWIEVECKKDVDMLGRKESHKIRHNTIKVVDRSLAPKRGVPWEARNAAMLPKLSQSIEELDQKFKDDRTSLGLIRPREVMRFIKKRELTEEELAGPQHMQQTLDGRIFKPLQDIPHVFQYIFRCNDAACYPAKPQPHKILCEDWELYESLRAWKSRYETRELLWEKLHEKFYDWMVDTRELFFIMGMFSRFPSWLIIGLYYPPKGSC